VFPSGAERRSTHGARRRSLAGLAPPRSSTARPSPPAPTRAPDVPDAPTPPPKPPASGPPAIHGSPPRTSPGPAPNAGTRAPARAATPACQSPSHARKPPAPSDRVTTVVACALQKVHVVHDPSSAGRNVRSKFAEHPNFGVARRRALTPWVGIRDSVEDESSPSPCLWWAVSAESSRDCWQTSVSRWIRPASRGLGGGWRRGGDSNPR
jgi:hypothetical protein